MSPRPSFRSVAAILGLLVASANISRADTVPISGGTGDPGSFSGSLTVTPGSNTSATITVVLTNTSPAANGGFITGFAFNDPNGASGGPDINNVLMFAQAYTAGAPPTNSMSLVGVDAGGTVTGNAVPGSPYGSFDLGAAVGGDLLGKSDASAGIEVGQTGTFVFTVTGRNLNNLTADGLLATMTQDGISASFIVVFRGFNDGTSDKLVIGGLSAPTAFVIRPVPAPAGIVLAGVGLGCCLIGRVFRRKTTA